MVSTDSLIPVIRSILCQVTIVPLNSPAGRELICKTWRPQASPVLERLSVLYTGISICVSLALSSLSTGERKLAIQALHAAVTVPNKSEVRVFTHIQTGATSTLGRDALLRFPVAVLRLPLPAHRSVPFFIMKIPNVRAQLRCALSGPLPLYFSDKTSNESYSEVCISVIICQ